MKWAIELEEFDIIYVPRTTLKDQALANVVAEFTGHPRPALRDMGKTTDTPTREGPSAPDQDL